MSMLRREHFLIYVLLLIAVHWAAHRSIDLNMYGGAWGLTRNIGCPIVKRSASALIELLHWLMTSIIGLETVYYMYVQNVKKR